MMVVMTMVVVMITMIMMKTATMAMVQIESGNTTLMHTSYLSQTPQTVSGLHKLWYPSIWDTSTWSKFGAHGEHGDVFLFSNLGAL